MKEYTITQKEEGQRLERYLEKRLPGAPRSFLFKMLRKKNIVLNGKKAAGSEILKEEDRVRFWLSDETISKFSGAGQTGEQVRYPVTDLHILYEDAQVLLVSKPAGMLSQKAGPEDVSLCEYLIGYMLESGQISPADLLTVKPSVCNRLDRNTSGIICCGKTSASLAALSELLRTRRVHKYYHALVMGTVAKAVTLEGYLARDEERNLSRLVGEMQKRDGDEGGRTAKAVCTRVRPLENMMLKGQAVTLIEAQLVTGRSHQIRAQLSEAGHTLVGDVKYASREEAAFFKHTLRVTAQRLHCQCMVFPELSGALAGLSGMTVTDRPAWEQEDGAG